MKKIIFAFILVSLLISGCKKVTYSVGDDQQIFGQIFRYNNLLEKGETLKTLNKKVIYISPFPSDSINYIYSAKSDSLGRFVFSGLKNDKDYLIFIKDSIHGFTYSFYEKLRPSTIGQVLIAKILPQDSEGILLKINDVNGEPVNKAKVYLYKSKLLAESKQVESSIYSIQSDNYGQAIKTGLDETTWYAYVVYDSEGIKMSKIVSFVVQPNSLTQMSITLEQQ